MRVFHRVVLPVAATVSATTQCPHASGASSLSTTSSSPWCLGRSAANEAIKAHARAVVRLSRPQPDDPTTLPPLVCTGWFLGADGHILTNYHCISSPEDAAATTFEVSGACTACTKAHAALCLGPATTGATLVAASEALDYALVRPFASLVAAHGVYLQLHATDDTNLLAQDIYILQHPGGGAMTVAKDDIVRTTTAAGCDATAAREDLVGYALPTAEGSSGSPVVSSASGLVIALHTCGGGCSASQGNSGSLNAGIRATAIAADLARQGQLPSNATASPLATTTTPPLVHVANVRGTLFQRTQGISIDTFFVRMHETGAIEVNVRSRRDTACDGSYFDAKVLLVSIDPTDGSLTLLNVNDNAPPHDAILNYVLPPGEYYLFVGTSAMTADLVLNAPSASAALFAHTADRGSLFSCGASNARFGSYDLSLRVDDATSIGAWTAPSSGLPCHDLPTACTVPSSPASTASSPELRVQAIVAGTLVAANGTISHDLVQFSMPRPGKLALDVVSFQQSDDGALQPDGFDAAGLCGRAYVDTVIFIFETTSGVILAASDGRSPVPTTRQISISTRDPYLEVYLPGGNYTLVVGHAPLTLQEALHVLEPGARDAAATPLLCGEAATKGHYHVLFLANQNVVAKPSGSFDRAACTEEICNTSSR
ncbi:Aste57867_12042 [Aphanomyces stellatus]|uniref:Aste57867_12042 protein n=1 Tax=Aphanomyces stellatus TaxID=120398 RepID=A0A485KV01_9STRA|nr:hypothetical protein As57867_011997 [Aphanomyces stellatus]VFT88897.1 Aste57867_12042 [Aphanomyces stellatus]